MSGRGMDINAVFIGPQGHVVHPARLEHPPRTGELVTLEGLGNFRVLQLLHSLGTDEDGNQRQMVTVFLEHSSSKYHSTSQEAPQ